MKKPNIKIKFEPGSDRDRLLLKISSIILIVLVLLLCGVLIARRTGSTNGTKKRWQASAMSELASASDLSDATVSEIRNLTDALKAETVKNTISEYQNLGIVQCSSYINLRSAPDQKDISNIKGMLSNHAAVDIIEEHPEGADGWMKIRSGGMEGYISSSFVITGEEAKELVPELIESRACIVTDKLRIRSTPEIRDGNTVGSAAKGEKYQVLRRIGSDWLEIVPDNIDGVDVAYMSSKPENVSMSYGLDEARSLDLRQKVLNMYDHLGVSKASDYVNVRKTPEEDGINNIVGKLPGFAGANILGEENGWYKIQSGKVTGYVRADFIASGTEAEQLAVNHAQVMAIVNTDALNVRSEPSTDSQAWTQITRDQRYSVINQLDGWVQLDLDSGDDEDTEQGSYVSTRDNNVSVTYALQEAVEYYPALDAANKAAAFRSQIVNFACQYVGGRYVWGGNSLTNGVDCSGFTQQVLKHFGISVPRVSRDQARTGTAVSSQNMKPGDLIFYANRRGTINHVGMYIGNGQVVNAASRRSGIRIYRWNYRTPVAIRNVIGS
ncbi:C40 family peptidase [Oribacterium sp. HCP28S3_H8]|uniref:C40 family peptidase n=1 Tax=Oribacterium sp. HCP28S3_H8 TaxID=3438945 RepID=UPI003F88ADE7